MKKIGIMAFFLTILLFSSPSFQFKSDELLIDDDEFGLEGAPPRFPEPASIPAATRSSWKRHSELEFDSKIQFSLEHVFGDSDFFPAGTFSARLKTWNHGGQTLTKLRFSRNGFTDEGEGEVQSDDFYRIRLSSSVLSPPRRDYIISSVKARCLPHEGLDEHFVTHTEGVNILAVNYGSPGACPYPRQLKLAPIFTEEVLGGENGEGEGVQPPEGSFWAKYWMYLIPLGFIFMNAIT